MAFPSLLSEIRLLPHEVLAQYSDDISDDYPSCIVSHARALRNAFKFYIDPQKVAHFKSFRPWMLKLRSLRACLTTLCHGDSWAVEFGQCAHLAFGAMSGALEDSILLSLHSRLP